VGQSQRINSQLRTYSSIIIPTFWRFISALFLCVCVCVQEMDQIGPGSPTWERIMELLQLSKEFHASSRKALKAYGALKLKVKRAMEQKDKKMAEFHASECIRKKQEHDKLRKIGEKLEGMASRIEEVSKEAVRNMHNGFCTSFPSELPVKIAGLPLQDIEFKKSMWITLMQTLPSTKCPLVFVLWHTRVQNTVASMFVYCSQMFLSKGLALNQWITLLKVGKWLLNCRDQRLLSFSLLVRLSFSHVIMCAIVFV
jgi:hypothetical protein